mmetsp:Transcript_45263/g.108182  ORF Transcript_45263/g.108182 Transcript_45263/m.108182 type:complete len:212 (-) Transcript_45263:3353-3988(-)
MHVSSPFWRPSRHDGSAHCPPEHTPSEQSEGCVHASPAPHGSQPPPQSTSDSSPFLVPSEQEDGAEQRPSEQMALEQSALETQGCPTGHVAHPAATPQSTPVSTPFVTPSSHVGRAQMPMLCPLRIVQTPVAQSLLREQRDAASHFVGQNAPQSMSPSAPLRTPSSQDGGKQTPEPSPVVPSPSRPLPSALPPSEEEQTPDAQSESAWQAK